VSDAAPPRRWLGPVALALCLGVPLLLLTVTVLNLLRWSEAGEALSERGAQLARLEAKVRGLAAAPQAAPAATASPFLDAETPSLARAELQKRLVDLVERAGGRFVEVQMEDEPSPADPKSLLARVTLDARNPGLVDLLAAIETGRPVLTVEGLNVRPAPNRTAGTEEDPVLRVAVAVRGYQREGKP
jgi:general secretion pathway protein M